MNESATNSPPHVTRKYDVNTLVSDMNGVNVSPFSEQKRNPLFSGYKINTSKYIIEESNDIFVQNNNTTGQPQFYYNPNDDKEDFNPFAQNTNKYKNHIMEKYLRDCQKPENYINSFHEINNKTEDEEATRPSMISKWLESAANFRPSENNYLNWTLMKSQKKKCKKTTKTDENINQQHGKEELDAAEALTTLANAHTALKL